jgi:hypothetical protein
MARYYQYSVLNVCGLNEGASLLDSQREESEIRNFPTVQMPYFNQKGNGKGSKKGKISVSMRRNNVAEDYWDSVKRSSLLRSG